MLVLHLVLLFSGAMAFVQQSSKPVYNLEDAENLFEDFIKEHNKQYNEQEKNKRLAIFKQNLLMINELNSKPGQTAVFGINKFADMSAEEFESMYTGLKPNLESKTNVTIPKITMDIPDNFDWRVKKVVTPVKDQRACGSCWAFSTTGNIEGQYAIKYHKLVSFSEQQMVDCDRDYDGGCFGGLPTDALRYLEEAGGIQTEEDYPYKGRENDCVFDSSKIKAKITGQKNISLANDDAFRQSIMKIGPISIGVHVDRAMIHYKGGIYNCPEGELNHAVLIVGFGKSDDGKRYWIMKNSWGKWGDHGYMYILAEGNPCGMKADIGVVAEIA